MKIDKEKLIIFAQKNVDFELSPSFMFMGILILAFYTFIPYPFSFSFNLFDKILTAFFIIYILFIIWLLLNFRLSGGYNFLALGGFSGILSVLSLVTSMDVYEQVEKYFPFKFYQFILIYILVTFLLFIFMFRSINKISLDEKENSNVMGQSAAKTSIVISGFFIYIFVRSIMFSVSKNLGNNAVIFLLACICLATSLFSSVGYIILFKFFCLRKYNLLNEDCQKRKMSDKKIRR